MPRVTLSFDNGPHPEVTPAVLETLGRYDLRATFFVVGENLETADGRSLVAEAHAQGHWIGNHTYHHETPLGQMADAAAVIEEIARTDALIGEYLHPDRLFRPYGQGGVLDRRLLSEAAVGYLRRSRATCVIWSAVPRDWIDPDGWVDTAFRQIAERDESLVVLHDIASGAMAHLPRFIETAMENGVEFRQEFPDSCVLMRNGEPTRALDEYVTSRA